VWNSAACDAQYLDIPLAQLTYTYTVYNESYTQKNLRFPLIMAHRVVTYLSVPVSDRDISVHQHPPQWIMDRQNGTYVLTTLHWPATICHITLLRASHHIAMHWIFHEDASNWKCQLVHIHRQYWKKVVTFWLATEYDSWPPTVWKIQFDQVRFNVPLDTM